MATIIKVERAIVIAKQLGVHPAAIRFADYQVAA